MSLPHKFIVFLGRTFSGHNHDYTMLQQEFPPEVEWFADLNIRVDLGYLGIKSDYLGEQIDIPTKKPRKSQKNPNPQLSDAQKGLDHGVGHFRPLSITRQRHLVAYHGTARSHASLCQVFRQFMSPQPIVFPLLINAFLFQ